MAHLIAARGPPKWICKECTTPNLMHIKTCVSCASESSTNENKKTPTTFAFGVDPAATAKSSTVPLTFGVGTTDSTNTSATPVTFGVGKTDSTNTLATPVTFGFGPADPAKSSAAPLTFDHATVKETTTPIVFGVDVPVKTDVESSNTNDKSNKKTLKKGGKKTASTSSLNKKAKQVGVDSDTKTAEKEEKVEHTEKIEKVQVAKEMYMVEPESVTKRMTRSSVTKKAAEDDTKVNTKTLKKGDKITTSSTSLKRLAVDEDQSSKNPTPTKKSKRTGK